METNHNNRLKLIDLYLLFWGYVGRAELIQHFDVSTATASRTLKEYREAHPDNMTFKVEKRSYMRTSLFQPAYNHSAEEALELFAYGQVQQSIRRPVYGPARFPDFLANLDAETVSELTRAITEKRELLVEYASGSSGISARWLSPHALFLSSGKWYFRAYCYKNNEFRNFILGRVLKVIDTRLKRAPAEEGRDVRWLTPVTLTLAPHSKADYPETLRIDLGLNNEPVRNIHTTSVLAGFVLNDLRVDCSRSGCLDPKAFNLQLMNRAEVKHLDSMSIAPGFEQ